MSAEDECLAWFVPKVLRLRPPGSPYHIITPGWTYRLDDPQEMRKRNLVTWEKPVDALWYSRGATICRVRLRGKVMRGKGRMRGMIYANEMTVIWLGKWGRVLEHFVCDLAEQIVREEREIGRDVASSVDSLIEQKKVAIECPGLREAYSAIWRDHPHLERALSYPAHVVIHSALSPYFIGQGDKKARAAISYALLSRRYWRSDLDEEIARLLFETFGNRQ